MAQKEVQLDKESFSCWICLDPQDELVTIPCGHSFCMGCIKRTWDGEDEKNTYSCPQCRLTFTPRPDRGMTFRPRSYRGWTFGLWPDRGRTFGPRSYRGWTFGPWPDQGQPFGPWPDRGLTFGPRPGRGPTVTPRPVLVESPLVDPSKKIEENICSHHVQEMNMFWLPDQQSIWYRCCLDEHKDHDTVSAEKDNQVLQQEVSPFDISADEGVENDAELWRLIKGLNVTHQIRSQQTMEASRVEELQPPEPETRDELLKYARQLTLDERTANTRLSITNWCRKATLMNGKENHHLRNPNRFMKWPQVLGRESLTGRCYWEVEMRGEGVDVAVAYKDISRDGIWTDCGFGRNDKSWALVCSDGSYTFRYNNVSSPVSGPRSSRVGVYLDHSAGVLSFFSVSKTTTLLHRVQTTFTQPLYAGLRINGCVNTQVSAEFCLLK